MTISKIEEDIDFLYEQASVEMDRMDNVTEDDPLMSEITMNLSQIYERMSKKYRLLRDEKVLDDRDDLDSFFSKNVFKPEEQEI